MKPLGDGRSLGAPEAPRDLRELFLVFSSLALSGFGGVLPWAQRVLVERRRWMSRDAFLELLALAQLMPGPNVCNLAVMAGDRWFGWRGAAVALAGMLAGPILIVLGLAIAYARFADVPAVRDALAAMAAVAAGLMIATAIKLALTQRHRWKWLGFALAAFVVVGLLRWPVSRVLAVLAPAAVILAWLLDRHDARKATPPLTGANARRDEDAP